MEHYHLFWEELFLYTHILHSSPYDEVLTHTSLHSGCVQLSQLWQVVDLSKSVADIPEWFNGCCLNYAENLLRYSDMDGNKTAIITCGE